MTEWLIKNHSAFHLVQHRDHDSQGQRPGAGRAAAGEQAAQAAVRTVLEHLEEKLLFALFSLERLLFTFCFLQFLFANTLPPGSRSTHQPGRVALSAVRCHHAVHLRLPVRQRRGPLIIHRKRTITHRNSVHPGPVKRKRNLRVRAPAGRSRLGRGARSESQPLCKAPPRPRPARRRPPRWPRSDDDDDDDDNDDDDDDEGGPIVFEKMHVLLAHDKAFLL